MPWVDLVMISEMHEVLQLDCPGDQIQSCQWKEMNEKMENGRVGHVAIPLPESYDICN